MDDILEWIIGIGFLLLLAAAATYHWEILYPLVYWIFPAFFAGGF